MTPQEASKTLEMFLDKQCDLKRTEFAYNQSEVWSAVNMASEALEKQIPKKVDEYKVFEDGAFYNIDFVCPACGWAVIGQPYEPDFCKHCGQALDWSDTE